jgi:hypothetical protein
MAPSSSESKRSCSSSPGISTAKGSSSVTARSSGAGSPVEEPEENFPPLSKDKTLIAVLGDEPGVAKCLAPQGRSLPFEELVCTRPLPKYAVMLVRSLSFRLRSSSFSHRYAISLCFEALSIKSAFFFLSFLIFSFYRCARSTAAVPGVSTPTSMSSIRGIVSELATAAMDTRQKKRQQN